MNVNRLIGFLMLFVVAMSSPIFAADYVVDSKGMHASINFRIKHLGYSWLTGRFNHIEGTFSYDENNVEATKISIEIDPASIDSNHAERDKHLRDSDFLHVKKYPDARFVSTRVESTGAGTATLYGDLTLHGITREIQIQVTAVGGGPDPWGGYRQGFTGTTKILLKDFGIDFDLGPASTEVEFDLNIEGIRKG